MLPSTASEISGCLGPSSLPWLATSFAANASASLGEPTAATCRRDFPDGARAATFSAGASLPDVDTLVTKAEPTSGPRAACVVGLQPPVSETGAAGAGAGWGAGGVIEEVVTAPSLALGVL